jgi:hypothetical protein
MRFLLLATTLISTYAFSTDCRNCNLSSIFQESGHLNPHSCFLSNSKEPSLEQITYRGCAIPKNYSEYCAKNSNFCKLLDPISPSKETTLIIKNRIGSCKVYDPRRGCVDKPRYRTHTFNVRETSYCQTKTTKHCSLEHGFLGELDKNFKILEGIEVKKTEILGCDYKDDPPCDDLCDRNRGPFRSGGGGNPGYPSDPEPLEPLEPPMGTVPVREVPGLQSAGGVE